MLNFSQAVTKHFSSVEDKVVPMSDIPKTDLDNVQNARFLFQMAHARGRQSEIFAAEKKLQKALATAARRNGARTEDVLVMHQRVAAGLHSFEGRSIGKVLVITGLAVFSFFLIKSCV